MFLQLAPMEGVVDALIRDVFTDIGGYSLCTTEFVRVTNQVLPPKVFYRYCPELHTGGLTRVGIPVFVQLLGSSPDYLLENALVAVSLGARGIDLNFGCPAKTVNRHDGGASLLKDPDRIYEIVSKLRQGIDPTMPLSAKVRLGFEDKSKSKQIAQAVDQAGASFLGIHARTKREAYRPPAHWEYIASMKEGLSIPVLANGDIWSVEDWRRCKEVSGCEDFLLGRGAFARPELANEIHKSFQTEKHALSPMEKLFGRNQRQITPGKDKDNWESTYRLFLTFIRTSNEIYGAKYTTKRAKQWLKFLKNTYPDLDDAFQESKILKSVEETIDYHRRRADSSGLL